MTELISIIVPVYNSARYLKECLDSIQRQTWPCFELLLVDDGSTDNSRDICRQACSQDERIRLLEQDCNRGVSAARNAGIEAAKGKYLFFLDSDDTIHPRLLETLYRLLEKEGAAIATEYYSFDEKELQDALPEEGGDEREALEAYIHVKGEELWEEFMGGTRRGFSGIGGKMIRRDALKEVRFDESLICGEDTKFIYQLLAKDTDAVILNKSWYYYRKHEACASSKNTIKEWESRYKSLRYMCDKENEYGRVGNALRWENYILKCVMEWEFISRKSWDREAEAYLKKLASKEKNNPAYALVDRAYRRSFSLLFLCYPLYIVDHRFTEAGRKRRQAKKQKRQKALDDRWERQKMLLELRRLGQENIEADRIRKEQAGQSEEAIEIKQNYHEKISVIIPLYNSEAYIRQCIRSVRRQTHTNLEIIVVDDGSTDRGPAICREQSGFDDRIRLITQENKGVSAARNRGLESASGKYVFFLDSDDAIHPLLLEELLSQAEEFGAELALCEYEKQHAIWMEKVLEEISEKDTRPIWQIVDKEESEEWIHIKYASALMRVGALVRRDLIGDLRFDEDLIYGEDTLFMYHLVCKGIRIAYSTRQWYYYRMHEESVTHSLSVMKDKRYFNVYRSLRDGECERGHNNFAMTWERRLVWLMRQRFMLMKRSKDEEGCRIIRQQAFAEREQPLFGELALMPRMLFVCCFWCYPVYYFLLEKAAKDLDKFVWVIKARLDHKNEKH